MSEKLSERFAALLDAKAYAHVGAFAIDHSDTILSALRLSEQPPTDAAGMRERAEWDESRAWVAEMTKKHGKPDGTQYEEGQNDMGARVLLKLDALAAIRKTKEG